MEVDTLSLMAAAQKGDESATERLFRLIRDEHMPGRVRRHYTRNVLVEPAAIDSEFLQGCWLALPKAKLDVGNPMLFLLFKGSMAVADLFRSRVQAGVQAGCHDCGHLRRVLMRAGRPVCRVCGSEDIETYMYESNESHRMSQPSVKHDKGLSPALMNDNIGSAPALVEMESVWFTATKNIQIEELRARLNGRVLQLFDLIVIEEINHASSKNYLKEIATRWGVTTPCVAVYLRQLRAAVERYYADG